jgi:hypothetical protein
MGRHLLRLFQIPAIGQVDRNAGCPEGVAADLRLDPGLPSSSCFLGGP